MAWCGFRTRERDSSGGGGTPPPSECVLCVPCNTPDTIWTLERRDVVLASLPADTFVPVPLSSLARIFFWNIFDAVSGVYITESFEYRINNGVLEMRSTVAFVNLAIEIFGDFISV